MIRHSPAEKYIEYLLVHPDQYSNDAIIKLLRLKQLDFLSPSYLDRLREGLRAPHPFRPQDRFHRPSMRFVTKHQLFYLFQPDKPMERALYILDNPRAKEVVETMLITDDPPGLISYRMKSLGMKCDTRAVERYRFFFFNTYLVDGTEMRALLYLRTHFVPEDSDEYEDQMRAALKKAAWRDPRRMVADHPVRPVASLLNQMRMGFMPSQLELGKLLVATRAVTATQIYSSTTVGGPRSAAESRDYAMTAKMLTELLQEIGSPDSELQRDLQLFALKTEQADIPYVGELPDGSYTVDVQPIAAEKEVIDVD